MFFAVLLHTSCLYIYIWWFQNLSAVEKAGKKEWGCMGACPNFWLVKWISTCIVSVRNVSGLEDDWIECSYTAGRLRAGMTFSSSALQWRAADALHSVVQGGGSVLHVLGLILLSESQPLVTVPAPFISFRLPLCSNKLGEGTLVPSSEVPRTLMGTWRDRKSGSLSSCEANRWGSSSAEKRRRAPRGGLASPSM